MALFSDFELKERDATTFNGAYQTLGTPLSNTAYLLIIDNMSKVPVYISFDGTTDHIHIASEGVHEYKAKTVEKTSDTDVYILPAGTQIYVKGANSVGTLAVNAVTTR